MINSEQNKTINKEAVELSIVIPVYNEEGNIQSLAERLEKTIDGLVKSSEIIFVDDGSQDASVNRILEMQKKYKNIRLIKLSRNFGQHIAAQAGFDYCRGEAVIWMDGDLQEPPEEIAKLFAKYKEGYDVVYTNREFKSSARSWFSRLASKIFKGTFNKLAKNPLPGNISAMRIMSRRYLQNVNKLPERVRYLDGIFGWVGFKSATVTIKYVPRHAGRSNYNFIKRLRVSTDAILSFSMMPLRLITGFGLIVAVASFTWMLLIIIGRIFGFMGTQGLGWSSLMVSVYFLGGVQCIFLGLIGEYLGRIYMEVKKRPLYIVEEEYNS